MGLVKQGPMKFPGTLKALLLLLALGGCGTFVGTPETATTLNGFRAANGLSELRSDATLTTMASAHAADMARRDNLNHDGFKEQRGPRGARAENVAYGCADTACVIRQWSNSSGHRAQHADPQPDAIRLGVRDVVVGEEVLGAGTWGVALALLQKPDRRRLAVVKHRCGEGAAQHRGGVDVHAVRPQIGLSAPQRRVAVHDEAAESRAGPTGTAPASKAGRACPAGRAAATGSMPA